MSAKENTTIKKKLQKCINNLCGRLEKEGKSFFRWIKERNLECEEFEKLTSFITEYLSFQIVKVERRENTLDDKIVQMKKFFLRLLHSDFQEQIDLLLLKRATLDKSDSKKRKRMSIREENSSVVNNENKKYPAEKMSQRKKKQRSSSSNTSKESISKFCCNPNRSSLEQNLGLLKSLLSVDEKKYGGLQVRVIDANQGYGVFATANFSVGNRVCDFRGKILRVKEAEKQETEYAEIGIKHSYTLQFKWNNRLNYVLDPTDPKHGYGRLLNHSRSNANVVLQMNSTYNQPRKTKFFFVASKKICNGDQLLWDYDPNNHKLNDRFLGQYLKDKATAVGGCNFIVNKK